MKVILIGSTGFIGSKLSDHRREAVSAAPSTGVNTLTDEGRTQL